MTRDGVCLERKYICILFYVSYMSLVLYDLKLSNIRTKDIRFYLYSDLKPVVSSIFFFHYLIHHCVWCIWTLHVFFSIFLATKHPFKSSELYHCPLTLDIGAFVLSSILISLSVVLELNLRFFIVL